MHISSVLIFFYQNFHRLSYLRNPFLRNRFFNVYISGYISKVHQQAYISRKNSNSGKWCEFTNNHLPWKPRPRTAEQQRTRGIQGKQKNVQQHTTWSLQSCIQKGRVQSFWFTMTTRVCPPAKEHPREQLTKRDFTRWFLFQSSYQCFFDTKKSMASKHCTLNTLPLVTASMTAVCWTQRYSQNTSTSITFTKRCMFNSTDPN